MKKRLTKLLSVLTLFLFAFTACDDGDNTPSVNSTDQSIAETIESLEYFSSLFSALEATGLTATFNGEGPYTIFAPSNIAFDKLPEGTLESLTNEQLVSILQYHVLEGEIRSSQLSASQDVATLLGQEILVESANRVTVNKSATVINPDIIRSNGVIHTIDEVLLPEGIREPNIVDQASSLGTFTTLLSAAADAGLVNTLKYDGDFTVFAPTDNAFAALPDGLLASLTTAQLTEILTYHVLSGEVLSSALEATQSPATLQGDELYIEKEGTNVMVNGATNVVTPDVDVSNGVIHAIDKVLLPDAYGTVVDAAAKRYDFSTLVQFVIDAGLVETLSNEDASFTVFAPTNEAFAKLPTDVVNSLTTQDLVNILTYHVVPTQVTSGQLQPTQDVETVNGEEILITTGDAAMVNGYANIVATDVLTNNGVIHVIDEVLLPEGYRDANIIDQAKDLGTFTTLVGAVETAGLTSTLKFGGDFTVFAPTDDAFSQLPSGLLSSLTTEQLTQILTYHVLSGEVFSTDLMEEQMPSALSGEALYITKDGSTVTVNGNSSVATADVDVTNGVIHAVDEVLLPNAFLNVVQIASKNYELGTLVSLVSDAGLVPTLEGAGPFTIFAPTKSAFDAVSSTLAGLTEEQVAEVLQYHVVAAEALSSSLSDGQTVETVQGENITIAIDGEGKVTLNGSVSVETVDLQGTNGVIHIIDGVLLPPSYQN